ncbi:HNH endonuclease [uncultured Draconibacterium sp.]|uniref:HNH endonuclease n=1 Tax=uncultured Draconibacterium sp. TaxID=1573823 RepID=UPI0029C821F6|nr:HNH endonuclease [uncultured Draconibacterium sp.]
MRVCIWCNRDERSTTFDKMAHIVPQSLGGKLTCENVCDECNHYFGSNGTPPIETVFKEAFNITRYRLLTKENIGKNKPLSRFKSIFFEIKTDPLNLVLKQSFKLKPGFQAKLCRQFKRGIYKVFLEENERVNGDSLQDRFDFIREFARRNIGDYPLLYFPRKNPMMLMMDKELEEPGFSRRDKFGYLLDDYGFYEVEFLGHLFSFPTSRRFDLGLDLYLKESIKLKKEYFENPIQVNYLTDIDLALSIMDSNSIKR